MGADWSLTRPTDTNTPSTARIYDYLLGGTDNYEVDREAAKRALEAMPQLRDIMRANRRFMVRAVRYVAGQGIDQFIDIGTGLPTSPSVPEVARAITPHARVVGVDHDPIVLTRHRGLVAVDSGITTIEGDVRHPDRIFADIEHSKLIDLDRPVAVLLMAVMHFVTDDEDPAGIIRALMEHTAPGSYLVVSVAASEGSHPLAVEGLEQVYQGVSAPLTMRPKEHIRAWFDPFHLVEPGLVDIRDWRPDGAEPRFSELPLGCVAYRPR
ncbi:MAG: SAM-dependent methyltransferase [Carbonactinosporaceae bacterium]